MCFGSVCFMANDYLWFLGDPNHSAMRLIYAMNAVIHSSVIFFHSLFLLSANADRIQALASFGTNGHRFFVAVWINAFMSLLRHNDIHYARACQVFSIESWKIWFDMSIDFFTLWFSTKRLQMMMRLMEKPPQPSFSFHILLMRSVWLFAPKHTNNSINDTKITFLWTGIVVKLKVHFIIEWIVVPNKSENERTKWNLLTIIFQYIDSD